jgi:RimJ/RimL family protein N-acetyltransferase
MIETERLILREFTADDAEANLRLGTDPAVVRWTKQPLTSVEESRQLLLDHPIADYGKHGFGRWACVLKSTGEFIGFCGLKFLEPTQEVDIGYRLVSPQWGRGYATEAARPCMDYGFGQLGLDCIVGFVLPENVASIRVLTKLGMSDVGTVEHFGTPHRRYVIDRAAWQAVTSRSLPPSGSP